MFQDFVGKKVKIILAFGKRDDIEGGSIPLEMVGIIKDFDENFVKISKLGASNKGELTLSNAVINKKYIITFEEVL